MNQAAAFQRALVDGDAGAVRRLYAAVAPHMPQPADQAEAEIVLHMARTQSEGVPVRLRAWSHAWLRERGLPSQLPDDLRPAAERAHPIVVSAVGVAVKAMSPDREALARAMETAMSNAVADAYANGDTDPVIVRARMDEAKRHVLAGA